MGSNESKYIIEALEPRILLSAYGVPKPGPIFLNQSVDLFPQVEEYKLDHPIEAIDQTISYQPEEGLSDLFEGVVCLKTLTAANPQPVPDEASNSAIQEKDNHEPMGSLGINTTNASAVVNVIEPVVKAIESIEAGSNQPQPMRLMPADQAGDTFVTPNSNDDLQVGGSSFSRQNWISGTSGGEAVTRTISNTSDFTLDAAANDSAPNDHDSITINSPLVVEGLQNFAVITGSGNDTLTIKTPDFSLPQSGGSFVFAAGEGDDTLSFIGYGGTLEVA